MFWRPKGTLLKKVANNWAITARERIRREYRCNRHGRELPRRLSPWLKYLPTVFYKGLRALIPAIAVGSSANEPMMRSGFSVAIGTSL